MTEGLSMFRLVSNSRRSQIRNNNIINTYNKILEAELPVQTSLPFFQFSVTNLLNTLLIYTS